MSQPLELSIIIPTHGSHSSVQLSIQSCLSQKFHPGTFEILVVSNLPDSHLESWIKKAQDTYKSFSNLHYLVSGKIGVNWARNTGGKLAKGKYLYFLDDDCLLPHPLFISEMLENYINDSPGKIIGGQYRLNNETHFFSLGYQLLTDLWISRGIVHIPKNQEGQNSHLWPANNLLGGNLLICQQVFKSTSGFTNEISEGGDEVEYLRRLSNLGYSLYFCINLSVYHIGKQSFLKFVRRAWLHGKAKAKYKLESNLNMEQNFWPFQFLTQPTFRKYLKPTAILAASLHLLIVQFAWCYYYLKRKQRPFQKKQ